MRKQLGGNPEQPQHKKFVLFLDETSHSCQAIHDALISLSIPFERHGTYFAPGTDDTVWLPKVGSEGWALFTCDQRIRYNDLERAKIIEHKVGAFILTSGNLNGAMMGAAIRQAGQKMKSTFQKQTRPFIAYISKGGDVQVRFDGLGSVHDLGYFDFGVLRFGFAFGSGLTLRWANRRAENGCPPSMACVTSSSALYSYF